MPKRTKIMEYEPYICWDCGEELNYASSNDRDTETIGGGEVEYYECPKCHAQYSCVEGLDAHNLCQEREGDL
jgi:DNA-directed RNA polymerase subunit RPC12/RpoP